MAAGRRTTDAQKAQFIENLRKCGVVRHAAAAAGIGQRTAYDLRAADEEFAAAWDDALAAAIGEVENSVREMACGYLEREFFDNEGRIKQRVFKRDVRAAQLYLSARLPEYRAAHKVELDANVKAKTRAPRVSTRRDIDLKAEISKLDKVGRDALSIVVKQFDDIHEKEDAAAKGEQPS